jgi:hypothetical protein
MHVVDIRSSYGQREPFANPYQSYQGFSNQNYPPKQQGTVPPQNIFPSSISELFVNTSD